MRRRLAASLIGLLFLGLAACGKPTKEDLLDKAKGVETVAELRDALGGPDDIAKAGPVERWTYEASNGSVVFLVVGDSVTFTMAGPD